MALDAAVLVAGDAEPKVVLAHTCGTRDREKAPKRGTQRAFRRPAGSRDWLLRRTPRSPAAEITTLLRALADALSGGISERLFSAVTSKRSRHAAFAEKPGLLLVGLQNPGYHGTRHNAGAMLLNSIVEAAGSFSPYESCDGASVAEGTLGGTEILACLPNSFMNLSGRCVRNLARRHNLTASQVVVMHDDLDLAVGRYKIKRGGSSGGHRGVESCSQCLGSADFARVRIGIGRPADKAQVPEFVLEEFRPAERAVLDASFALWGAQVENVPAAMREPAAMSRLLSAIAVSAGAAPAAATPASVSSARSDGASGSGGGRKAKRASKATPPGASADASATDTPADAPSQSASMGQATSSAQATPSQSASQSASNACSADGPAATDDGAATEGAVASAEATAEPAQAAREQSYGATSLKAALPEAVVPDAGAANKKSDTDSES